MVLRLLGWDVAQVRAKFDDLAVRTLDGNIEALRYGLSFSVAGIALPGNPKTSSLAAYSLLHCLVSPADTTQI